MSHICNTFVSPCGYFQLDSNYAERHRQSHRILLCVFKKAYLPYLRKYDISHLFAMMQMVEIPIAQVHTRQSAHPD